MSASYAAERAALDFDHFDAFCDHLIIVDESHDLDAPTIVGNYRLLRESVARRRIGFYSASAFELAPLAGFPGEALELGRSCIHRDYRNTRVMTLLWQGIADYVLENDIGLMFGRASFEGTHVEGREQALSYLHHFRLSPMRHRVHAHPELKVDMDLLPASEVNPLRAFKQMPPLMKGYVRLGCEVGEGAVIDDEMDELDVCVILQVDRITERYFRHYIDRNRPRRARAA